MFWYVKRIIYMIAASAFGRSSLGRPKAIHAKETDRRVEVVVPFIASLTLWVSLEKTILESHNFLKIICELLRRG